jgi:hypothetical protein
LNLFQKPSSKLRGEFHSGGFLFSQRKSIMKQGEKFQNLKMILATLFIYLWLFAKDFEKDFPKGFAKTKQVVQTWSKTLNKRKASHSNLVRYSIGLTPSNLCTF